jgi:GNAT superfamily N-acetyltransferase
MPTDAGFLAAISICQISQDIDLSTFKCNPAIDWYLTTQARDHHEKQISTVHCFMSGEILAGYVTTSMSYVQLDESPLRAIYKVTDIFFRKGAGHAKRFPGLLIGMLGVCEGYRRKGLAKHMVKYVIGQARVASESVACRFVTVDADATPEATGLYGEVGFTTPEGQKRADTVRMLYDLGPRK